MSAFINANIDFRQWGYGVRGGCVLAAALSSFVSIAMMLDNENNDND
jgi:hypothetical protein